MKVKMVGGGSFYGPHGVMLSLAPGSEVDVDEGDADAVTFWQFQVDGGAAEMLEAPKAKAKATPAPPPASDELPPPPKAGPGSSRDAWVEYAEQLDIEVTDDMTRDDIIAAVES